MATTQSMTAWIQDGGTSWYQFYDLTEVITADKIADVVPTLREVEEATRRGFAAAGFVSYDAASAFDASLAASASAELPFAVFGIYRDYTVHQALPEPEIFDAFELGEWQPLVSESTYRTNIEAIKAYIAAGDTYQVNYTFQQIANFTGDPWALFYRLCKSQDGRHSAYIDTPRFSVCSASPELFFYRNGNTIVTRPMKGTASRGVDTASDHRNATDLKHSAKNRAENLMIVDMVRNDLGRIAQTGTVHVKDMFHIEQYKTVLQMTSTVVAQTSASLPETFEAIFPCSSITGAPKKRTMEIIKELEQTPRGVYTGTAGCVLPSGYSTFNVDIRTPVINKEKGEVSYGVGGGIVWDSEAADEFSECETKALVLSSDRPALSLFETILWTPEQGYSSLLPYHLNRVEASAAYFNIGFDRQTAYQYLQKFAHRTPLTSATVCKFLLHEAGGYNIETRPAPPLNSAQEWSVALVPNAVHSSDWRLYHKTTERSVYNEARRRYPSCDDVLLMNEKGEITESTIANVVVKISGDYFTPFLYSGLLAGTKRQQLLDAGYIKQRLLQERDIHQADQIYLINSIRGWIPVKLV